MAGACEILEEILEEMEGEVTCAICRSYFSQPVTIDCMHSFCRACLTSSWTAGRSSSSCPLCREVSQSAELPGVNDVLAQVTDLAKELSSQLLQSTEGHSHCATHNEVFKLFCEDDQTPLCLRCSQSQEHGTHKLSPVDQAAHNSREKLQHIRSHLGKSFDEAEKALVQKESYLVDWHLTVKEEYHKLHLFLMEEEFHRLKRISEEENTRQDRLSQHVKTLQDLMAELEEAGHKPNVDLLQDVKQLLGRSQSVLCQNTNTVIPELSEYSIPGMIKMFKKFRVDIRMNPATATPCVTVSEDLRSVRARDDLLVGTKSLVYTVLAEQAFSSGRQYWEVDVTQLPQWTLGIFTTFLRRKRGRNEDSCPSVFLLKCVKKEEDYYLQSRPESLNHRMKGPLSRVGVYLEYTPGILVFYNVLKCSLIYRFHPIRFTAPVTPIFSPGPPLPGTKAGPMTLCSVDSHLCACCYTSL